MCVPGLPPLDPAWIRSMAIFHLQAKIHGRADGGGVVGKAAYRACVAIRDERQGLAFDYTRKRGLALAEILLPEIAPGWMQERGSLWNAVEASEKRKDAQLAREFELALPIELTHDQQAELVRRWVRSELVSLGMAADVAIHEKEGNPHAHVLTTLRAVEVEGFSKKKPREWNDKALLEKWRSSWSDAVNLALEQAEVPARVTHLSYAKQGIPRVGRNLPRASYEMEKRGERSILGDLLFARIQAVEESTRLVQEIEEVRHELGQSFAPEPAAPILPNRWERYAESPHVFLACTGEWPWEHSAPGRKRPRRDTEGSTGFRVRVGIRTATSQTPSPQPGRFSDAAEPLLAEPYVSTALPGGGGMGVRPDAAPGAGGGHARPQSSEDLVRPDRVLRPGSPLSASIGGAGAPASAASDPSALAAGVVGGADQRASLHGGADHGILLPPLNQGAERLVASSGVQGAALQGSSPGVASPTPQDRFIWIAAVWGYELEIEEDVPLPQMARELVEAEWPHEPAPAQVTRVALLCDLVVQPLGEPEAVDVATVLRAAVVEPRAGELGAVQIHVPPDRPSIPRRGWDLLVGAWKRVTGLWGGRVPPTPEPLSPSPSEVAPDAPVSTFDMGWMPETDPEPPGLLGFPSIKEIEARRAAKKAQVVAKVEQPSVSAKQPRKPDTDDQRIGKMRNKN